MNRKKLLLVAMCALWLAGCVAELQQLQQPQQAQGGSAPGEPALEFCVPPLQDPNGSSRRLDFNYSAAGLKEIPALSATAGCDLMLQFSQHSGDTEFRYEVSSAYSGAPMASGQITNWVGVNSMVSKLMATLRAQFAPGTDAYRGIAMERRKTTGVAERPLVFATPERQQQIDQAAQEGDAAMAAGDERKAFAAYTRVLSGPYSDDPTSHRVRARYMPLVAAHPQYLPPVPEAARMHMVRANAILKDSQEFEAYDQAAGEMAAAIGAAPWWADAYYNIALVAEKAGYVSSAIGALQLYLAANPRAPDARAVQDKIYALEVKQERAGRH